MNTLSIPAQFAWVTQEIPSFIIGVYFIYDCIMNETYNNVPIANRILLICFIIHYFRRTFIYSLSIRGGKSTKFLPWILAILFTIVNGFGQSLSLMKFDEYKIMNNDLYSFRFIFGLILFIIGIFINIQSDNILKNLRSKNDTKGKYKIPKKGLFNYVTAAHYFGENIEWLGFAIAANNACAYSFAFFTFANLYPRALHTHEWYLTKFDDYPKNRKVYIPFFL